LQRVRDGHDHVLEFCADRLIEGDIDRLCRSIWTCSIEKDLDDAGVREAGSGFADATGTGSDGSKATDHGQPGELPRSSVTIPPFELFGQ